MSKFACYTCGSPSFKDAPINSSVIPDVNARYPFRVPDWLWMDPGKAYLLPPYQYIGLAKDIEKLQMIEKLSNSSTADSLESNIAQRLCDTFAIRDLASGGLVVSAHAQELRLAVQFDPTFDEASKQTLCKAVKLFLRTAMDQEVINIALERSIDNPPPMPNIYDLQEGKPVLDEVGRPIFTKDYRFYLQNRAKPLNAGSFMRQLKNALSSPNGDPALLLVSRYVGNVWWGGSYYGFFSNPVQQVSREKPSRGFLYIRLNADKLAEPEPNWNDAVFWASKIAHEVLHNLGYWHPNYKDPAERDANNVGNDWAFIVSYEVGLREKLTTEAKSELTDPQHA